MTTEEYINVLNNIDLKNDVLNAFCRDTAKRMSELNNQPTLVCDRCAHNGQFEMEICNGYPSPCTTCRVKYFDNFKPLELKEGGCYCISCRRIIYNDKIFRRKDDPTKGLCFDCY